MFFEPHPLFSFFEGPITTKKPLYIAVSLANVYDYIHNGQLQEVTNDLRSLTPEKYKECKKQLDFATFGGVFRERKADGLTEVSGFVVIDIDELESMQAAELVKMELAHLHQLPPALVFVSPSGKGVKAVYYTNCTAQNYSAAWKYICDIIEAKTGQKVDKSGKDISRTCFLCHDGEAYFDDNFQLKKIDIPTPPPQPRPTPPPPQQVTPARCFTGNNEKWAVNDIIEQIEQKKIDIAPTYAEWLQIGFAFANTFGATGYSYFERISQQHGEQKIDTQQFYLNLCKSGGSGGVKLDTFFYLAKYYGIETRKTKKTFAPSPFSRKKRSFRLK